MKNRPSPHQHHSVVNRNANLRERRARDALFGTPAPNTYTGDDHIGLEGRLKVVADRQFKIAVEHHFRDDVEFSYEDAANPINQLGATVSGHVPLVTSNDFASFMAAFNKRCNFKQGVDDDIDDDSFREALAIISDFKRDSAGLLEPWDENETDRADWLSKFAPSKQRRMNEAYGQIHTADTKFIGTKDLSVKQECLIKRDDPEWAPRVIYAGNDVFNAITGPASNQVMKRLVHLTRVCDVPIGDVLTEFAYSTTDVKLCDFLFADPAMSETVEGDFSRNDREQRSRVAHLYDAWLDALLMPQWFRTLLLSLETFNVRSVKYGFSAKLAFQLPTGTTSTTPRNSTYNATMYAVGVRRQLANGSLPALRVNEHSPIVRCSPRPVASRATILGDDILARLFRRLVLDDWVKTVASFKMVLKAKAPRINGEATLLSRRIFADVDRPCMVPLLGKMLVRFNVRATINDGISDSAYMAGKALSYAYECRHVPTISRMFLTRYKMEQDHDKVQLEDLTWFTKTSNLSLDQIIAAIKNERVVISEDDFGLWCCEQYDLDYESMVEMFAAVVLNPECVDVDLPFISLLKCDL